MMTLLRQTGLRWLWVALLVLVADLSTKFWVITHLSLYEAHPVLPFLNMTFALNTGAAFSFLGDLGGMQRWFLAFVAIAISAVLFVLLSRLRAVDKWLNIAYTLVIGGALGNLFDRLVHGVVVDFIDFHIGNWHYPIFNIADIAICVGAFMLAYDCFFGATSKRKS